MPRPTGRQKEHAVTRLAERAEAELERESDALTEHVQADLLDDQQELSEPAFLNWWRAHWPDSVWRMRQLERMGVNGFVEATNRAFNVPKPVPLGRLVREGREGREGQAGVVGGA